MTNAELSPAGDRAIFATAHHVYLLPLDGKSREIGLSGNAVNAVWFAPDGRALVWSDDSGVHVTSEDGERSYTGSSFASARFRDDGTLDVVHYEHVVAWDPRGGEKRTVFTWRPQPDLVLRDAERFAGGALVVTTRYVPDRRARP